MPIHRHIRLNPVWLLAGLLGCLIFPATLPAQTPPEDSVTLKQIVDRLDRLEKQNHALVEEVHALRQELAQSRGRPDAPPDTAVSEINEKLAVDERRIEEHAQTKVESSQHLPLRITGMALFNAFLNSRQTRNIDPPVLAPYSGGALSGAATLRQTILGIEFRGPETFAGGQVHGTLNMDFFGGSGEPYNSLFRIRTAALQVDWKTTSVMFGQDKPLIAPRDPNSLSYVAIPPLSGAGNLWLWQPQARVEQRFRLDDRTALRAQVGLFETREDYGYVPPAYTSLLQERRPALEGHFELTHSLDDERRLEFGSGFHTSTTHIAGATLPSRVFALDWFANPWRKLEFSGAFFRGRNLTNLGGIGQGVNIVSDYQIIPVHAEGGWAQLSFIVTPRLSFNLFGGGQYDRNRDLLGFGVLKNEAYAVNLMYRLGPNVIFSVETGQVRTDYLGTGNRLNNHNDLAIAYLF